MGHAAATTVERPMDLYPESIIHPSSRNPADPHVEAPCQDATEEIFIRTLGTGPTTRRPSGGRPDFSGFTDIVQMIAAAYQDKLHTTI
ncbi:hypothetical protein VTH06DRAFT_3670 [Thermothelomyces fergusii]